MDGERLASIRRRAEELNDISTTLFEKLQRTEAQDGSAFDVKAKIPDLDLTIEDLYLQLSFVCDQFKELPLDDNAFTVLVPALAIHDAESHLKTADSKIRHLVELLDRDLKSIDDKLCVTTNEEGKKNRKDFGREFKSIAESCDHVFTRLLQFRATSDSDEQASLFGGLIANLKESLGDIENCRKRANDVLRSIEDDRGEAEKSRESSDSAAQAVEEARQACDDAKRECQRYHKQAEEDQKSIAEIAEEAEKLRKAVSEYSADFQKFQEALDGRNRTINEGNERQTDLLDSLQEIEMAIKDKDQKASEMLGHSTIAGLASSFGTTLEKLNNELWWARRTFEGSIILLIVSISPMVLYFFPELPVGGPVIERQASGELAGLAEVIARTVVLVPGLLFARFAARRHSELFRLREHYQYKYNMAASVEGFRQLTPEKADDIAGATYEELLSQNPAEGMGVNFQPKDERRGGHSGLFGGKRSTRKDGD